MTTNRKKLREKYASKIAHSTAENRLDTMNDAYTQGSFKYLRFVLHLLGIMQFYYGIYYYFTKLKLGNEEIYTEEERNSEWGGNFRFLTFLNLMLQALYHTISFFNDIFGSNEILEYEKAPILRKIKDNMFATLAFPISHIVCIIFWIIFTYDRELIFPAELDAVFPKWLNHVVHTNVSMFILLDMFTCFHIYPKRFNGLLMSAISMLIYEIWLHIVYHYSGVWVYAVFDILNTPMRFAILSFLMGLTLFFYMFGEYVNGSIWKHEMTVLKTKIKNS